MFGFRVHAAAALERWQAAKREEMQARLKEAGIGGQVFREDRESAGEEGMEEEEDEGEGAGDGLME